MAKKTDSTRYAMPALRFKTCRLLPGNVRNRVLSLIQRRILRRLRNKRRSIKRNLSLRENLNSNLNRGARLTEVPKQPQYSPLPIEKQIEEVEAKRRSFYERFRESISFFILVVFCLTAFCVTAFAADTGGGQGVQRFL